LRRSAIEQAALGQIARHGTRDPFEIAERLGVEVLLRDDFKKLKGMYKVIGRPRFVFVNANLGEQTAKIICAHELGHDLLHRALARSGAFWEFMLYDMKTRPEYEANCFAAALLLPDEDVLKYAAEGYDAVGMAGLLATDVNLLMIKISEMSAKGYPLRAPYTPRADFLGK
jgi:Zn-dependent peptidase ImmA (M78 family)